MSEGKTSTTAYGIACAMSKLAQLQRWRPLFTEEVINLNTAFMRYGADTPLKRFMRFLPPRGYLMLMEALFVPGMCYHFLFRKRWVEEQARKALAEGVRQALVLGAGFDTLAMRLAGDYPDAGFFEIDLPATQRQKLRTLEIIGHTLSPNCRFIAADLAQDSLQAVLKNHREFRPDAPSLVILEGVLMYLREEEVRALFTALRGLFKNAVTVLFGATAQSDDEGSLPVRLTNRLMLSAETANKWHCPAAQMQAFMMQLGYEVRDQITYKALQRQHREEADMLRVPEEDENYYAVTAVAKMPQT